MKVYYIDERYLEEEPTGPCDVGVVFRASAIERIVELEDELRELKETIKGNSKDAEFADD